MKVFLFQAALVEMLTKSKTTTETVPHGRGGRVLFAWLTTGWHLQAEHADMPRYYLVPSLSNNDRELLSVGWFSWRKLQESATKHASRTRDHVQRRSGNCIAGSVLSSR